MKTTTKIAAISAIAMTAASAAFAWEPGDFGGVDNNWEGSPHLERNLANPTGTWADLAENGWLEDFPATTSLNSADIPRTEDGLPDIFGEWDFEWSRIGPQQADDNRYLSAEEGHRLLEVDFVSDEMFQEWQTRSLLDIPTNNCVPHHGPRIALRTSRLEVVRSAPSAMIDKVIFLHQQFNVIRKAYMDYDAPASLAARPVWGTTNGEWIDRSGDGQVDTLVMVTEGVQGSWIDQTGVTYETGAILTEEYWVTPEGNMVQHWIIEDPKTYAYPIHHTQWFLRYDDIADAVFDEYVCNLESARPELIMQRYSNQNAAAPAASSGGNY